MENLKNQIKVLAEQQIVLKNQRKTVTIKGERVMEPWQASYNHTSNRIKLRELYFAYGLLRGRKAEEIESKSKTPINMNNVNKLVADAKIICSNS